MRKGKPAGCRSSRSSSLEGCCRVVLQLVARPDVVEMHDVTAQDPKLLVHLKATRNSVPVPRHWCFKRKYLQGKRGIEKPPFELPDFIKRTGIQEMREALQEKVRAWPGLRSALADLDSSLLPNGLPSNPPTRSLSADSVLSLEVSAAYDAWRGGQEGQGIT